MKRSIGTDSLKLSISQIITTTIALVAAMLLSRFRTLEEYGTYSQLLIVINVFTTIFMLGLPNSINYFLARAETSDEKQRFVSIYYTLSTMLSVFTGLVLVCATPLIASYFNNPILTGFWYFLAVFPWTNIILASIDNMLIVYKKTSRLMIFKIANSVFILLSIIGVQILRMDFYAYMIVYLCGQAAFALTVYIVVKNVAGKIRFIVDENVIKKIFVFSIPIGLASVVGTLKRQCDTLVIARFFNTEQLAIFANAAREIPVTMIASSLTAVLLPHLVVLLKKDCKEEAVSLWGDATSLSYIVICFISTAMFVFAPEIMSLLYSEKYLAGAPVFQIYALVLMFRCTYYGMILNSIGKTKVILYNSIFALVLNLILSIVFYYTFGFIGPAIATLVATFASAWQLLMSTSKQISIPMKKIFPWKDILFITLMNAVFGAIFMVLKNLLHIEVYTGEILESVLLGLLWGVIYVIMNLKFIKTKWRVLNS
ncbi:MAG: oligosaccharide flippase family protein [Bacillota bacterium]